MTFLVDSRDVWIDGLGLCSATIAEGDIPAWSRHYRKLRDVGGRFPLLLPAWEEQKQGLQDVGLVLLMPGSFLMVPSMFFPEALDPKHYQMPAPTALASSPLQELCLACSPTNEFKSISVMSPHY